MPDTVSTFSSSMDLTRRDDDGTTRIQRFEIDAPLRAVIVDDDEFVLEYLKTVVTGTGLDVVGVNNAELALSEMQREFASVVIVDRDLPGMDGLELCRQIRTRIFPGYVYVILLMSKDSEKAILDGLAAGADDYLHKRASSAHLIAKLTTARRILSLEQSLRRMIEERRHMAMTDELTNSYNRRYFVHQMRREIRRALRLTGELTLLVLDIDHFKQINDRYGHATGDAVLVEFANRIRDSLTRERDWCARTGGEEFAVVLPTTDPAGAQIVAENLRLVIAATPMNVAGQEIAVTVSIGLTTMSRAAALGTPTVESMLLRADECLYESKKQGRNRVTVDQS
ncbi:MAG: diguanylate cyclase [Pseudomonadota bacterium]